MTSSHSEGIFFYAKYTPGSSTLLVGSHSGGASGATGNGSQNNHSHANSSCSNYARVMPGCDLSHDDYSVTDVDYSNYTRCQAACDGDDRCKAWTFYFDYFSPPRTTFRCALKSGIPAAVVEKDSRLRIVSGVKSPNKQTPYHTRVDGENKGSCPLGSNYSACKPTGMLQLAPGEDTITINIYVDNTLAEAYFQGGFE